MINTHRRGRCLSIKTGARSVDSFIVTPFDFDVVFGVNNEDIETMQELLNNEDKLKTLFQGAMVLVVTYITEIIKPSIITIINF